MHTSSKASHLGKQGCQYIAQMCWITIRAQRRTLSSGTPRATRTTRLEADIHQI